MTVSGDWRVPQVHIPRHPLWRNAYDGAWELWQHSEPSVDDLCATVLFARYANDVAPLHHLLDAARLAHASPLVAWAEWELYQITGDQIRLATVLPDLSANYEWFNFHRRRASGLYWRTEHDSPRDAHEWVDVSAQQALAAERIANSARAVGDAETARHYDVERQSLCALINERSWNERAQFYVDRRADGSLCDAKGSAGFWPLLAGVPSSAQAAALVRHLSDPREFWRVHVCPSLSADHPRYADRGAWWRGAVWPLDNYALVKGLERYGYHELALRVADNHITTISHVFKETQSLWDNYAPDYIEPGSMTRHDAVSTGVSAVALLLETILGLRVDAPTNTLHWRPRLRETWAVEQFPIGRIRVNVSVTAERATFIGSAPFRLHLITPDAERWFTVRDELVVAA